MKIRRMTSQKRRKTSPRDSKVAKRSKFLIEFNQPADE